MDTSPDLIVRNGCVASEDSIVDIAVVDDTITSIAPEIPETADTEINAEENLVSPGLVDSHVHLNMAFSAAGDRVPWNNDRPFDRDRFVRMTGENFAELSREEIESTIKKAAEMAVANGVLHIRTHTYVDSKVGTKVAKASLAAREALADLLDIEIVAFPQQGFLRDPGSETAAREAIDLGVDLVGGLDPASLNGDIKGTIGTWFDIATDHNVDMDIHLHDEGTLGMYTLSRLAEQTIEHDYEGRVTASHCFALADSASRSENHPIFRGGTLEPALDQFEAADLQVITCYQSTRPGMPIRQFHDRGLVMAHGTDQVRDLWWPHGNLNALEAMLVESLKLDSSQAYATNKGLEHLWRMITTEGAKILDMEESYRIEQGTPADLVVHEVESPQWAIIKCRDPRYVIKEGRIVAADGDLVASATGD